MADVIWTGGAPAVAQVDTLTVGGTIETGDEFRITINNRSVEFIATNTTIATTVAGLVAAWNASLAPEHAEVTAVDASPDITLTADTAGVPFTLTVATTESGGGAADLQTFTTTTTTSADGPNHVDNATNWKDAGSGASGVPVADDHIYLENSAISLLYAINQTGTALDAINISQTFTGKVGLPRTNPNGYQEYRPQYLAYEVSSAVGEGVTIGYGTGAGSGRIKLDVGATQSKFLIQNSGSNAESGVPAILLKGSSTSNTLIVNRGRVGLSFFPGDVFKSNTINIGSAGSPSSDVNVMSGIGTVVTNLNINGGTSSWEDFATTAPTITVTSGTVSINQSAVAGALNIEN
ncbi:hypothetical protein LCGC14_2586100, partial [marine sediment metagenome]